MKIIQHSASVCLFIKETLDVLQIQIALDRFIGRVSDKPQLRVEILIAAEINEPVAVSAAMIPLAFLIAARLLKDLQHISVHDNRFLIRAVMLIYA